MASELEWEDLVGRFAESVGKKKAEELVEEAVEKADLKKKNLYSANEVMEIADNMKDLDDATTYVNIAANTLKTDMVSE